MAYTENSWNSAFPYVAGRGDGVLESPKMHWAGLWAERAAGLRLLRERLHPETRSGRHEVHHRREGAQEEGQDQGEEEEGGHKAHSKGNAGLGEDL